MARVDLLMHKKLFCIARAVHDSHHSQTRTRLVQARFVLGKNHQHDLAEHVQHPIGAFKNETVSLQPSAIHWLSLRSKKHIWICGTNHAWAPHEGSNGVVICQTWRFAAPSMPCWLTLEVVLKASNQVPCIDLWRVKFMSYDGIS